MECTVFHTVENKENPDYIEQNAPFLCSRQNAWLGTGYYFWETFIDLAHWWGRTAYNNQYIICKSYLSCSNSDLLDLVGNTAQMMDMREVIKILQEQYKTSLTVKFVIDWLNKINKNVKYKAIRVHGIKSTSDQEIAKWQIHFKENTIAYLDFCPTIQICVLDKSILKLPLKIVYPEEYCKEYVT